MTVGMGRILRIEKKGIEMGFRKKKRGGEGLRLTDKKHPRSAVAATGLAVLSLAIFAVICFMSGESRGQSGIEAGVIGLLCFVISIVGFILSWLSLGMDNIRTLFPSIGVVTNGLLVLFYLIVYILGT